eukprot:CAMPEP_0170516878 /NCGR_PEP_ID=MMETSP0209-20121228/3006_1 /TAXON_ID=665100 ORGANISM="Litonotus pictus, Strain P1" /NCGR_SAMPLE_ID=MMETSP0209 /ASSEMBLY_ACC=CAM_ASM_000301 /LENGTH=97 /DNA_ID=CAMNT_0010801951 /DNA_START=341 /DNA_END=637 /DNA_ORIENTATION=-
MVKINETKMFAGGNLITVIVSTILSGIVLSLVMGNQVNNFFINSYHRKLGGSDLYRKLFWAMLVKKKSSRELMQDAIHANAEAEEQKNQENIPDQIV